MDPQKKLRIVRESEERFLDKCEDEGVTIVEPDSGIIEKKPNIED